MTDNQPNAGDPPAVMRAATVSRPPAEAFAVFTDQIGAWWPLPTHGLFGDLAGAVLFRNGRLVEQSVEGAEVVWGEVLAWEPPARIVLSWHPGQDLAEASEVEITFEPAGAGTRVIIEHRGWERFGQDALRRRLGYVGPNAWGYVLDHYADGAEVPVDELDTAALAEAYEELFVEADRGGFGSPPEEAWDAEQVLAHVALNDLAMLGVCQALVHGASARFENLLCHDRDLLAAWIESSGGMAGLIEHGRHLGGLVEAAVTRLSPEQRSTEVHCRLLHEGQVMVDRPLPWQSVAVETQATRHLPAHVEQLRNLRH